MESKAEGKGGNLEINTGSFSLASGATMDASTRSRGDAGNIIISARDRVSFDSENPNSPETSVNGKNSGVFSRVVAGEGNGGNIEITTDSLSLTNGAQVSTSTDGRGDAGNISLNAGDRKDYSLQKRWHSGNRHELSA